ncbi:CU044_5270 family protein [Actinomadura rifamycini]|uniref:CU044_5270 family protein n=1 Tax=Actinomadura rifamycini TaxID=31962 RepID=UPI00042239DF|nr:CU044_5270 family protein [Actinomadura rifamycini]
MTSRPTDRPAHDPADELVRTLARVRDGDLAGYADRPAARALLADITAASPADAPARARRSARRFPRLAVRLAAAGALAAAATAGVVVVSTDDGRPPAPVPAVGSVAHASEILDGAVAAAAARPYTAPGPEQWLYTKVRMKGAAEASGAVTGGPYETKSWELWRRVDGKHQYAAYRDGKLTEPPASEGKPRASRFDPLPTDPDALLRKIGAMPGQPDELAFGTLITILAENLHPPQVEAAIFGAMRRIPGVTATEGTVDAAGRPAVTLGLTAREGWVRQEVLLDPETYRYLGERSVTVGDRTLEGDDGGDLVVKSGTLQYEQVRTAAAIVDEPGERP